jgi:hypothetical protein
MPSGLLCHPRIFGFAIVSQDFSLDATDQAGVAAEKNAQCLPVVGANPRNQGFIGHLCGGDCLVFGQPLGDSFVFGKRKGWKASCGEGTRHF